MGLFGDIAGKVVLKYEADTAQAKIALRELTGEQKANAKAAIQGMEDQKAAHDRMVKGITVGLGIAAGAIAVGVSAYKAYAEQSRLAAASAGADMSALRKASHGLMTDLDLMSIAAQGMNGRFKLTSAELENVLGAAVELERNGFGPLDEIARKLGEAIKKGEIDPLKELGIVYDETLAKTDKRAAAIKALAELSKAAAAGVDSETERIRQSATRLENMWDGAKAATGEWVVSTLDDLAIVANAMAHPFTPPGGGLAAQPAGASVFDETMYLDPTTGSWVNFRGLVEGTVRNAKREGELARESKAAAAAAAEAERKRIEDAAWLNYKSEKQREAQREAIQAQKDRFAARGNGRGGGSGGGYELNAAEGGGMVNFRTSAAEQIDRIIEEMAAAKLAELNYGALGTEASDALAAGAGGKRGPRRDAAGFALGKGGSAYGADKVKQPTMLERMFGTPDDIAVYDGLMAGLMSSVTAGYEALVTGSESFGKAAKRVIGQTIMAEGSHMLVLALREGAMALAGLAKGIGGNPKGFAEASAHGLAAAKFAAGAALAGVVASQLGAGGSATAAGASAGGGGGGSSTVAADNAPRNTNIVLGHGWDDETNRQRAARFARAQRQAASYESPAAGIVYS